MKDKLFSISLKDCSVQYYKGSGAGGQKRNKTNSAARVVHELSGAVGQCENHREQSKNKKEAFKRMTATKKFKKWIHFEASRVSGELRKIENRVDEEMKSVKVEVKNSSGKWTNE